MTVRAGVLAGVLADALAAVLVDRPEVAVLAGRNAPAAAPAQAVDPARVLTVPGGGARLWAAAGMALAQRAVVTLLDDRVTAERLTVVRELGRAQVLVADDPDPEVVRAAAGAGAVVVRPVWRRDVAPLLRDALGVRAPVLLALHGAWVDEEPLDPVPVVALGAPRVIRGGGPAVVAGAGALVAVLPQLGRMLAGRGVPARVLDLHTLAPGALPDPGLLHGHLLVGVAEGPVDLLALQPVAVGAVEARTALEAVLAALPVERLRAAAEGAAPPA